MIGCADGIAMLPSVSLKTLQGFKLCWREQIICSGLQFSLLHCGSVSGRELDPGRERERDGLSAKPVKHWFASRMSTLLLALSLLLILWVAG